jgi:hypothetical protein
LTTTAGVAFTELKSVQNEKLNAILELLKNTFRFELLPAKEIFEKVVAILMNIFCHLELD